MKLSYEDAFYYKLLCQSGYEQEVNDWIGYICDSNELLEGITLELAFSQGKINDIISCLHNYIGDNSINDKEVCDKLGNFILKKLNKDEITIEKAVDTLCGFSLISNKMYETHWYDLYIIGASYDLVIDYMIEKSTYIAWVREFLENGTQLNTTALWNARISWNKKKI